MGIQFKCFSEIINIGYVVYKSQNLPWFRTLSWYFLLAANYYFYGETMIDQFGLLLQTAVSQLLNPQSLVICQQCHFYSAISPSVCLSVGLSVGLSVSPSVGLSVGPSVRQFLVVANYNYS